MVLKNVWIAIAVMDLIIAGVVVSKGDHLNTVGYFLMGLGFLAWAMR